MSGPGVFLFFTGLIMFALGLILLISLSSKHHHWWMWFLLIIGFFLMVLGGILWFASGAVKSLSQGSAFQGVPFQGVPFQGVPFQGGEEAEMGEAGLFAEAEELAVLA